MKDKKAKKSTPKPLSYLVPMEELFL